MIVVYVISLAGNICAFIEIRACAGHLIVDLAFEVDGFMILGGVSC